jgi:hypothetical protein
MQIVMRNQGARLDALLSASKDISSQEEVMRVYEEQIGKSEAQSRMLIGEIRRLAKVSACEI